MVRYNELLDSFAEKAQANVDVSNTHKDEDGLLVCNVCGKHKQIKLVFFDGKERVVNCICKCDAEEEAKRQAKEKEIELRNNFKRRQQYISTGYRDIYLESSDTPLPQVKNYIEKFEQLQQENKQKKDMLEVIVSIAKNRQGPLQDFDYHFYGHLCRFTEQKEFRKPVGKRRRSQGMRRLNGNNNE